MGPLAKKVVTALAAKEVVDRIQALRKPKPSVGQRVGKALLWLGVGGGVLYLAKTGRLEPLLEQAKGLTGTPPGSEDPDAVAGASGPTSSSASSADRSGAGTPRS